MSGHDLSNSVLRSFTGICLLSLLVVAGGCESKRPSASNKPTTDQSPQAKFDRIVDTLRDKLETTPSVEGTSTQYKIEAPDSIKESAPGKVLTATIKVTQSSSYSYLPPKRKEGEEEAESKGLPQSNPLGETKGEQLKSMGLEVFDESTVDEDLANAFGPQLKPLEAPPRTIDSDTHIVYELVYEKDRWRLASLPPTDVMEATTVVMEQALKRQN